MIATREGYIVLKHGFRFALIFFASASQAQELRCEIKEKFVCESKGCQRSPPSVWSIIDQRQQTYSRCDKRSCDTYPARIFEAGIFLNVEVPGRSVIAKMALHDEPISGMRAFSFHEVATQFHSVLVSYGDCKRR